MAGLHRIALVVLVVMLSLVNSPSAAGIPPPAIDPELVPPDVAGPEQPYEQRRECATATTLPDSTFGDAPWPNGYLDLPEAQKFATGLGVTVAVIDTGVNASPRVPAESGGDYVDDGGDGLSDCDAHGTLTAAIIAGRPAALPAPDADSLATDDGSSTDGDAFIGVAPDARLISLRQTSAAFEAVNSQAAGNDPNATPAAGSIRSLARSVVHAANLGANVINISEAACFMSTKPVDESTLGAALNYAVNVKNAVVVVAAGNTGGDCVQNPSPDPSRPADPRGWDQVQTIVTPAWYSPLVLAVGGIGPDGSASEFSMHGPWVGAAAPAQDIVALGNDGRPVNALQGADGPVPIAGTSFAAAYVSGLAALVRQRYPDLTAAQVVNRITASARHPGGGVNESVGAGVISPVAALTWDIPVGAEQAPVTIRKLTPPAPVPPPDHRVITAVALGIGGLTLAVGLVALGSRALKRR